MEQVGASSPPDQLEHLITELGRLTAEVAELHRSNDELDRFAATVAHDLRSPLMSLALCLSAVKPGQPSKDTLEYVAQARESVAQMTALIARVLSYACVGSVKIIAESMDMEAVLKEAIASIAAVARHHGAKITHDDLPTVTGDRTLLVQLLQNLLENGLKYGKDKPRIHVAARREGADWVFSISDTGIGIPAEHLEDIFLPFTRLHSGGCAGTGLGLATCRRIVERHGGRIWAESKSGDGSTFSFTLPG
jgi:signal transduction histidine kinase